MDTAAFIVTLLVFVAVGFWYVENEMKKSDGAHGIFAVRQVEKSRKARGARYAASAEAGRYQPRAKPAKKDDGAAEIEAGNGAIRAETPKYRRKERAWDRAVIPDDGE